MHVHNKNLIIPKNIKRVIITFGTKCNLHCTYCHQTFKDISFNKDILQWLKELPSLSKIKFSGGEPLLYKKEIDSVLSCMKDRQIKYTMMTNGTLLNDNNIEWLNKRPIHIGISYDGNNNLRNAVIDFSKVKQLKKFSGIATVFTSHLSLKSYYDDITYIINKYGFEDKYKTILSVPLFVHQTINKPNNNLIKDNTLNDYLMFIKLSLDNEFEICKNKNISPLDMPFIYAFHRAITKIKKIKSSWGVKCCNEYNIQLLANGDFMLCGYGTTKVGDIYSGIDTEKVESFIPEKCKQCSLWNICRNPCVLNVTDNECKIVKEVYPFFIDKLRSIDHATACL